MTSSYEGLQEGVKDFDTPEIEGWEFKYPGPIRTLASIFLSLPVYVLRHLFQTSR